MFPQTSPNTFDPFVHPNSDTVSLDSFMNTNRFGTLEADPSIPIIHTCLSEANIYYNSAIVTRTGSLSLTGREDRFYIADIPDLLNYEQVRFSFSDPNLVWHITGFYKITPKLTEGERKEKESIQAELGQISKKLNACRTQITTLNNTMNGNLAYQRSTDEILNYIESYPDFLEKLQEKEKLLLHKQEALLAQLSTFTQKETSIPVIELEILEPNNNDCTFSLTYHESQVSWKPIYDINILKDEGKLAFFFKAQLQQNTSEDWKLNAVTFLTGNYSFMQSEPQQSVWQVRSFEKPKKVIYAQTDTSMQFDAAAAAPASFYGAPYPATEMLDNTHTTMLTGTPAFPFDLMNNPANEFLKEFRKTGPIHIRSGSLGTVLLLQSFTVPASFHYSVTPKKDCCSYLKAVIAEAGRYTILPENANIFMGQTALGQIRIPRPDEKDEITLSLGQDNQFRVSRKLTLNRSLCLEEDQTLRKESAFSIHLLNLGETPVNLMVLDQIPVSSDANVVVELTESSGADLNPADGELKWDLILQPKESRTLSFGFTITYPTSIKVTL